MNWQIICGTLLIIAGGTFLQFANLDLANSMNDLTKYVDNKKGLSLGLIFESLKGMETPLGKPYLGKLTSIKKEVILFGPDDDSEYIYIHEFGHGMIVLSMSNRPSFIENYNGIMQIEDSAEEDSDSETGEDDILSYSFRASSLLNELTGRMETFLSDGIWDNSDVESEPTESKYYFKEEFKWSGQDFHLFNEDGEVELTIRSSLPCKTFRIYKDDTEIFMMTKRILHFLPQYDLYAEGKKLCRLKKRIVLHHDYFSGKTEFGKLELKSVNSTIGVNYNVLLNEENIGTIAQNIKPNLENIVFDNYLISVNKRNDLPLMTAMAVMAAREASRDRLALIDSYSD